MANKQVAVKKESKLLKSIKKYFWLYLFVLPAVIWYVMFCYAPHEESERLLFAARLK